MTTKSKSDQPDDGPKDVVDVLSDKPKTDNKTVEEKALADKQKHDEQQVQDLDEPETEQPEEHKRTVRQLPENTYTYPQGQGNTNPADFEVFDERGNFVEKRDR